MAASIQDLKSELTELKRQRATINLPDLEQAVQSARADKLAFVDSVHSLQIDPREAELSQALSAAENALSAARSLARDIDRKAGPLERMTSAASRMAQAHVVVDSMSAREAFASTAVADCKRTVTALEALRADSEASYLAARESGAKTVLEAARSGRAAPATGADRSQLDTIEQALDLAQTELYGAQAKHNLTMVELKGAERELAKSRDDAAAMSFELKLRDFVAACVEHANTGAAVDVDEIESRIQEATYVVG